MMWALAHFCWLVDSHDWALTPETARELRNAGLAFLEEYQTLAMMARDARKCRWAWKPKIPDRSDHAGGCQDTQVDCGGSDTRA
eukprot:9004340-Alexandrium_andersonii.AAC.1